MSPATIGSPTQPKLFISYAHSDKAVADRLVRALSERGVATWRPDVLSAGDSVAGKIGEAIRQADAVAVLLSRDAAKSPWVSREIAFALSGGEGGKPKRVIPVLLEPEVDLPPFLRDLRYIDLADKASFDNGVDELVAATAVEPRPQKQQARELQLRQRMLDAERAALMEAQRQMYEEYSRRGAKLSRTVVLMSVAVALLTGVGLMIGGLLSDRVLASVGSGLVGLAAGAVLGYRRGVRR